MTAETLDYPLAGWSLDALFKGHDSADMKAAFARLEQDVAALEARREELIDDISTETFMELVNAMEASTQKMYHVYAYSQLWFSENTQDQTSQAFVGKVQQFFAGLQNRTLFFSLWWKALDDENAARLRAVAGPYQYWLDEMRNFKPHTLTEAEEKIVNIKDVTGASALNQLYSSLTNRYSYAFEVNGEEKSGLTRGELMSYVYSPDPDVREAAYQELYRVYGEDGPILGQIYQHLVRDWRNENVDMRSFSSPISVRNLYNDIPDDAVDTLLDVAEENAGIFQKYFKMKAKWLGVEKMRRYDIYAPVVNSEKTFDYNEAIALVLEAFEGYEPKFAELSKRVFDDGHVHSVVQAGKRGGAFCYGVDPKITPWVLVNFDGKPRDVATIAHELGHAIHAMLASHHTTFTFHSSLPLAETASTFAEMIVVDHMLSNETDESVRRDLLFRQVDDNYATIMRQVFFALFEREAHEKIHENASVDELAEAYMQNLRTQFGDSLDIGDEFRWEWVSIPHIYGTPFYVYAYAFGQLLVLSLYKQFKLEGDAFKPKLIEILSAGGSKPPAEILTEAGIDISSASFWQGGFDVLADLIKQLEAIPPEVSQ
jgi:oligoendopeptidase F